MLDNDPRWYQNAVLYEIHVRAFHDADEDGIGDFPGLTQKLDYLHDLGVTCVWLLPFYPSPLKDDGYDIADYTNVHPQYGTLADFDRFVEEAHRRGIRVVTELVVNHTSDQHPWFQRARRAPKGSPERDFYVWTDNPELYKDARVIFQDFEPSNWAWDPVAGQYYWHRFYSHQPDLNFDNPAVAEALFPVVDFWFARGVDGLRLDAVPYLFEREGTQSENLPETHRFLKELRAHVDRCYENRMLLAEANQWPEDAVAYFGTGDECHMAFHFPLMPRLYMAIHQEDRFPILDILEQTPPIPDNCQWALFLRNHDELTLEMVTDEERAYLSQVYAEDPQARINLGIRRRLAPLLKNDRRRIELMNGLLFSMPGTPVIYYGDEIGMGDNIYLGDRNGVRTPMQWGPDLNAGFSRGNPQKLYLPVVVDTEYHYQTVNVAAQQAAPNSLLGWTRRLIRVRKRHPALGAGTLEFLEPDNHKVLAFLRRHADETVLVVANLSRHVQHVRLDVPGFAGAVPIELFGHTAFPPLGADPFSVTLGPHAFYWLALTPPVAPDSVAPSAIAPLLNAGASDWQQAFAGSGRGAAARALLAYLRGCRWFSGKNRAVADAEVLDAVPLPFGEAVGMLALLRVEYFDGDPDIYAIPVAHAAGAEAEKIAAEQPGAVAARLRDPAAGILYDAALNPAFCAALLALVCGQETREGHAGRVSGWWANGEHPAAPLASSIYKVGWNNRLIVYGDRLLLKLFGRVEEGPHPELEVGRFLTERQGFAHAARVVGALGYRRRHGGTTTLGVLQEYTPHARDARQEAAEHLGAFFARTADRADVPPLALTTRALLARADHDVPADAADLIGPYLDDAARLGQLTADLHRALAADPDDPAFAPEPYSTLYRRSLYQSLRGLTGQVERQLAASAAKLPATAADAAALRDEILRRFRRVKDEPIGGTRIQCHGDYRLEQVLCGASGYVVIDFEGQPDRMLGVRRLKRSPLLDVAGMLGSFFNVAMTEAAGVKDAAARGRAVAWARVWCGWVGAAFLRAYLRGVNGVDLLPANREELALLLDVALLRQSIHTLGIALQRNTRGVDVSVQALLELLASERDEPTAAPA